MITTVTLNPMLDKTVTLDALRRGAISRASEVSMVVGGKGVNVSRQLRLLGEETEAGPEQEKERVPVFMTLAP